MERDYKKEIREEFEAMKKELQSTQEKLIQNRGAQQALRNQEMSLAKTIDSLNGALYILQKLISPPKKEEGEQDGQGKTEESASAEAGSQNPS